MSMSRLFLVALALVSASAVFTMLTSEALQVDPGTESAQRAVAGWSTPVWPDLPAQMASLQDMHQRFAAAQSDDERRVLLAQSERVMSEGVAMMRRMKAHLPASDTGRLVSEFVSESESTAVVNFLSLMELLVQLKGDREAIVTPAGPTEPAQPARIHPSAPAPASVKAYA
jgi:hypothetical protein